MPRTNRSPAVLALAVAMGLGLPAMADLPATASETDRLIFAERDFSAASSPGGLAWTLDRQIAPASGVPSIEGGRLTLSATADPGDGKPMLQMRETGAGRERLVGRYPAEGMDPVLVYFLESASRNVSALAGGSADYVRNRFKEALRRGGEVTRPEGGGARIVLKPLAGDANAARMNGFDALTLTIDVDERKGAPIRSLVAEVPGAGYRLSLTEVAP